MKATLLLLAIFFSDLTEALGINQSQVANLPIWSELTPFETQTLNGLAAAKRGSDEALLRLYIFASGDIRTRQDYLKIKSKIDYFFKNNAAKINNQDDIWQKGYLLNRAMHQYFFSNTDLNSADAYEESQSQLTEVFSSGYYNCVSSTALYLYLARRLDLDVKAVVLPTHTFVELDLHNGNKVEVETTSPTGFDWAHDRKFYKEVSNNWFSERNIAASTFEDYQNRKIISAWELAALNMRNQHTNPSRMKLLDRLRLSEASIYLKDSDPQAWLAYLYVFNELFIDYNKKQKLDSLLSFYEISYSRVNSYLKNTAELSNELSKELSDVALWYFSQASYTYMKQGKAAKAKQILLSHYQEVSRQSHLKTKLFSNYQVVFSGLLEYYIKQKKFSQAENLIDQFESIAPLQRDWQRSVIWYYSERIKPLWNDQDWNNIIDFWKTVKHRDFKLDEMKKFIANISAAYQNYSLSFERKGNWKAAAEILLQCTETIPLPLQCTKRLQKLKQQHKLFM